MMVENVYFKVQKVYCVILSRDFQIEDFKCQYEWSIQDNYFIEPTKLISRDTPESLSMAHQSWGLWNCDRIIWNNKLFVTRIVLTTIRCKPLAARVLERFRTSLVLQGRLQYLESGFMRSKKRPLAPSLMNNVYFWNQLIFVLDDIPMSSKFLNPEPVYNFPYVSLSK